MIHLEWALLNAEISAALPSPQIDGDTVLFLQSHCTLLRLDFPARALFNETPCEEHTEAVMVYQLDGDSEFEPLHPLAARVFTLFKTGCSLSDAFDTLTKQDLTESELAVISDQIQSWMSLATRHLWLTIHPDKESPK